MRYERWRQILAARSELDKLVASAVGDYPNHGPPRSAPPRSPVRSPGPASPVRGPGAGPAAASAVPLRMAAAPDTAQHAILYQLHEDVHARIEQLRAALAAEPGGEQAMLALVLYFDEYIMGLLPDFLATSWPLLQTRLTGRKTGGSDFFRLIDRLIETEPRPEFALEVYLFCLRSGFSGQYADDLVALDRYQQRLRARIAAPEPPHLREAASAVLPRPIRSPALYYAAAALAIALVGWALTVWSNL
jgi:type IV/VI secretion system ImpK/VasF family protein